MKWIKEKLRLWLGICDTNTKLLKQKMDLADQVTELVELRNIIKDRTEYNIDVHSVARKGSQVILLGRYRNTDFIQCYTLQDRDFKDLIDHCRHLEKYSHRARVDAWPEFKATINNELSRSGF